MKTRSINKISLVFVVLFYLLAGASLLARVFPIFAAVCAPGVIVSYAYSALVTKIGPTGWGSTEMKLIEYSSALFYGALASFFLVKERRTQTTRL